MVRRCWKNTHPYYLVKLPGLITLGSATQTSPEHKQSDWSRGTVHWQGQCCSTAVQIQRKAEKQDAAYDAKESTGQLAKEIKWLNSTREASFTFPPVFEGCCLWVTQLFSTLCTRRVPAAHWSPGLLTDFPNRIDICQQTTMQTGMTFQLPERKLP